MHGDFWPGNVLWHDGHIAALLDWEDACIGDPLIDLACMRSELFRVAGAEAVARFTHACARHVAIDPARLPWWDLFMATAPLLYMDGWGLAPDELATRRAASTRWQARALHALGVGGTSA